MVKDSTSCRRCGRKLTDPESIAKGIGPVCEGKELKEGKQGEETETKIEA